MKSKKLQYEINAVKMANLGYMPGFIVLGHKRLEKSQPDPKDSFGNSQTFLIPKDILGVSISNPVLYEDIESIEFSYERNNYGDE